MGLFQRHAAPDAYDMVYGGRRPHHEITHELLAAAVGFEVMPGGRPPRGARSRNWVR